MKQNKTLILILGIVAAAALAVGLFFGVKALSGSSGKPEGEQLASNPVATGEKTPANSGESSPADPTDAEPGEDFEMTPEMQDAVTKAVYTVDDLADDDPRWEQTVASCGGVTLTNHDAQTYYTMSIVNLFSDEQLGMYASMLVDLSTPLSEQDSGAPGLTWEQYFLMDGMQQFQVIAALNNKAASEGHSLSAEEAAALESDLEKIRSDAKSAGYENLDEFLRDSFSPGVRFEDYERYLRSYYLAVSYNRRQYESIQVTADEVQAYVEANPESFSDADNATPDVAVRHILIAPETDAEGNASEEAKAAAKAKAEALLADYLNNPTEEYFARLAGENTDDPGSQTTGGLYEGIYPGQMVEPFDAWCFDTARKPGDTGIVETDFGYHIMYFVRQEDFVHWEKVAEDNIRSERVNSEIEAMLEATPLSVQYADIVLAPLPIMSQAG